VKKSPNPISALIGTMHPLDGRWSECTTYGTNKNDYEINLLLHSSSSLHVTCSRTIRDIPILMQECCAFNMMILHITTFSVVFLHDFLNAICNRLQYLCYPHQWRNFRIYI
jgi:hypothetical protein